MSDNLIQSNATTNKTSLKMSKWKVIKRAIAVDSAFKQKVSKFKELNQEFNNDDNLVPISKEDTIDSVDEINKDENLISLSNEVTNDRVGEIIADANVTDSLDDESILIDFWENRDIPSADLTEIDISVRLPDSVKAYNEEFVENSKELSLNISKLPEDIIYKQREAMEESLIYEKYKITQEIKKKEADVVWREHLARERLKVIEFDSALRLRKEKEKFTENVLEKEKYMGDVFRRAKFTLEKDLMAKQGTIKEKYGELDFDV
jgi:hypothetical protein